MKKKIIALLFIGCIAAEGVKAQVSFNTIDSVNINQINASVLVHGDMWWNPATETTHCFFPNGTQKNISFLSSLWMSGYDAGSNLHLAAQTYRQSGNDYWPGPLNASDTLTYATSHDWAKIWKVNRTDINAFRILTLHDVSNTPSAIWTWPAKGNTHAQGFAGAALTITDDMAPFVDLNSDGNYQPEMGEYPDFKGDQVLWWVFSDNGPVHTETHSKPLGVQIEAMATAYNRGDVLDRAIFYHYTIKNKSANTYQNFRVGQFADMDLGRYNDDYIGIDTARGMGIIYNAEPTDAVYGTSMPMAGLMMLMLRNDSTATGAGSFIYYNNDNSPSGNPQVDTEYNNYLRCKFRGGMHLTNDFTVAGTPTVGYGSGPQAKFVYPGDPANKTEWSECSSGNLMSDRRFIIASGDLRFNAGSTITLDMALFTTPLDTNNACGDSTVSFNQIKIVGNSVRTVFDMHGLPSLDVPAAVLINQIKVYPNPAQDELYIETTEPVGNDVTIIVFNALGQKVNVPLTKDTKIFRADISKLPAGLYNVLYRDGSISSNSKFVKE